MRRRFDGTGGLATAVLALGMLILAAAPASADAPRNMHYATTLLIIDPETREVDAAPGCLSFTKDEMCTEFGACGSWEFVKKEGRRNEWMGTITFVDDEDGTEVNAELRGVTERNGRGSSIGGSILATLDGVALNGGFGGTATSRIRCLEFGLSDDE
jgi:hypothetical protein